MLNPLLHRVLSSILGDVRISNENVPRVAAVKDGKEIVTQYGESYYVNCWCCGDTRRRLSISYKWLTDRHMSSEKYMTTYHCFNEGCKITEGAIFNRIRAAVEDGAKDARLLAALPQNAPKREAVPWRLPKGFVPLDSLPPEHPALRFIANKYADLTPGYLSQCYGVGYTDVYDDDYKMAMNRVIFPVYGDDGNLAFWQGRTIDPTHPKRWYLPPGSNKEVMYNAYRVPSTQIPILAEGIPAAIACGPHGVALFGKDLGDLRAQAIAKRWRTAIVALDPDTYVPDRRRDKNNSVVHVDTVVETLNKYMREPVRRVVWPPAVIDLARRKNNGEDVKVPDPADFGLREMVKLCQTAM